MDEQDKTHLADQDTVPVGVDLLAGASVKSGPTPQPSEPVQDEDTFVPPWMAPEIKTEEVPDGSDDAQVKAANDQFKDAIGLAIADVQSVAHGQEGRPEPAAFLSGQNLDPKTAAVVASAMASVFSGLSETRFSAQRPGAAQTGFNGFDNAEEIFRTIMGGSIPHEPEAAETPPVGSVYETGFHPGAEGGEGQHPPMDVVEDFVYSPPGTKATGEGTDGPPPKQQKDSTAATRAQTHGRGKKSYYGLRGRRKPQRVKIARTARAKGMRGQPNLEKTSLNLAVQVKTLSSPSRAIPIFFLAVLLILAFSKFGVIDQYQRLADAQAELQVLKDESAQIEKTVVDYASVQQNYNLYDDSWMSEAEKGQVHAKAVMDVVLHNFPSDKVRLVSIVMTNNNLEIVVSGVDLSTLSQLVETLKAEPLVWAAMVSDLAHTDETAVGPGEGGSPGTYKIILSLGEKAVHTGSTSGQTDAPVPEGVTPEEDPEQQSGEEPVVPERPVLPGEGQTGR